MKILIDKLFTETGVQKDTFIDKVSKTAPVIVSEYVRNFRDFENDIPIDESLLLYGSIQFVEDALTKFPNAVAFYSKETFKCSHFMSCLPLNLFLNSDGRFYPVAVLQEKFVDLLISGKTTTCEPRAYFVRSDSGRKIFSGKVIPKCEMHNFHTEGLSPSSFVFVAPEKEMHMESRFFIYKDQIISCCVTHMSGIPIEHQKLEVNQSAKNLATDVASYVHQHELIDKVYVLDIMSGNGIDPKIVELNAASTSDMHYCDITSIFNAMIDCIEKENGCE